MFGPYLPRCEYTDKTSFEVAKAAMREELPCLVCPFSNDLVRMLIGPWDQATVSAGSLTRGFEDLLQALIRRAGLPELEAAKAEKLREQVTKLRSAISTIREDAVIRNQIPCLLCPFSTDLVRALLRGGIQAVFSATGPLSDRVAHLLQNFEPGGSSELLATTVEQSQERISRVEAMVPRTKVAPKRNRAPHHSANADPKLASELRK